MIYYPDLDPNLINFHGITIKWYGVCHVIAFLLFYWRAMITKSKNFTEDNITDLLVYLCIGILFGGKLGYIIFYSPNEFIEDPVNLLKFWLPGRSFHGGLLGVIIAVYFYAKKYKFNFWEVTDFIAPIVPIGIACGRIGNFINGELWGRVTNVSWGMIFSHVDLLPRHPSQIYEFLLEGVGLYIILNYLRSIKFLYINKFLYNQTACFLIFYAIFRIFIENYRQPDLGQSLIIGMTKGQILSIPMLIFGFWLLWYRFKNIKVKVT